MKESLVSQPKENLGNSKQFSISSAEMETSAAQTQYDKFRAAQGHGYAAEQANTLYDKMSGSEALVVGGNNQKDGPDRLVNGTYIQTKYCQSGTSSVAAAFENGQYRYLNADGTPMQLEIPKGQYAEAVKAMQRRIEAGQVPGVSDPAEAENLIREGHVTYQQAVNIAKFGTIDSLLFDAASGAVISVHAMGITAAITFACSLWNGTELDIAVENAVCAGLQVAGTSFASYLITGQLMRSSLNKALTVPSQELVKLLGPKISGELANLLRDGAEVYGAAAMNNAAKLIRGNFLASTVITLLMSAGDIRNAFRGRISGKQLFKNIVTKASGAAGGTTGFLLGKYALKLIFPQAGKVIGIIVAIVGSTAGGAAGGALAKKTVGKFVEDDAVQLVGLIEDSFCACVQDYLLSEEEAEIILDDIAKTLTGEALMDMFASPDHSAYAEELVYSKAERVIRGRCRVILPQYQALSQGFAALLRDLERGTGLFAQESAKPDPVEIGRQVTGQTYSTHAAKKAWYAAKQMNMAGGQAEMRLKAIAGAEQQTRTRLEQAKAERTDLKAELEQLLGGNENG